MLIVFIRAYPCPSVANQLFDPSRYRLELLRAGNLEKLEQHRLGAVYYSARIAHVLDADLPVLLEAGADRVLNHMDIDPALEQADACLEHADVRLHARQDDVPFFVSLKILEERRLSAAIERHLLDRTIVRHRLPDLRHGRAESLGILLRHHDRHVYHLGKLDQVQVVPDNLLPFLHDRSKLVLNVNDQKDRIFLINKKFIHCHNAIRLLAIKLVYTPLSYLNRTSPAACRSSDPSRTALITNRDLVVFHDYRYFSHAFCIHHHVIQFRTVSLHIIIHSLITIDRPGLIGMRSAGFPEDYYLVCHRFSPLREVKSYNI
jgi:hypothetical protein